ncbi:MAG TPA: hypothetical protein VH877_08990 [Polyangia bacterium]|jgi:hypothetical protein|nr:hypothetical protein [Polyangia bacterium]
MSLTISRHDLVQLLERWQRKELDAAAVCAWVGARWPSDDVSFTDREGELSVAREVVEELDLLMVHLLTPEDVPALLRLLAAPPGASAAAVEDFRRYCAAIDRPSRSRKLRKDPLYSPFCV